MQVDADNFLKQLTAFGLLRDGDVTAPVDKYSWIIYTASKLYKYIQY